MSILPNRNSLGIKEADNLINHFVILGDMSPSMTQHSSAFVKAFDTLVENLAVRSKELDQETRVTVYLFSSTSVCAFYDMDVLRLPSIRDLYDTRKGYRTALLDATVRAVDDLRLTPQRYGQHAFVLYALTDGIENDSRAVTQPEFRDRLAALDDKWTVATLVPDKSAVRLAKGLGFPAGNIDQWDTKSTTGSIGAMGSIGRSIEGFMGARDTARRTGTKFTSTKNLFSMDPSNLNQGNLFKAGMVPLTPGLDYSEFDVGYKEQIKPYVARQLGRYRLGSAYYQLTKVETIQAQKQIMVRNKKSGEVFAGEHARDLLCLPAAAVKVSPQFNPDYDVFVQSTSVNRNLVPGTKLLVVLK